MVAGTAIQVIDGGHAETQGIVELSQAVGEPRRSGVEIDIDDAPFLALAMSLNCPIWSNDGHFKKQHVVKAYTTRELMNLL